MTRHGFPFHVEGGGRPMACPCGSERVVVTAVRYSRPGEVIVVSGAGASKMDADELGLGVRARVTVVVSCVRGCAFEHRYEVGEGTTTFEIRALVEQPKPQAKGPRRRQ